MIVWNILGWMLVIILGVICIPTILRLLYILVYILYLGVTIMLVIVDVVTEEIDLFYDKIKNMIKIWITKKQRQCSVGNTPRTKLIYGKNTQNRNVDYKNIYKD